jgi:outer membrane receptor protein involved in Fe transport
MVWSGLVSLCGGAALAAQGVSGAAIDGTITAADSGTPVTGAAVVVHSGVTGAQLDLRSAADGRFHVENLPPGGPYTVLVHAAGFAGARRDSLILALGQRVHLDFRLTTEAVTTLAPVRVVGTGPSRMSASRTGASHTVSDSAIRRLPTLSRDFTELIQTAPGVAGTSVGGANNRFNNILIDGGSNNDAFGLSRGTGTPGGQEGARSLPLEAVKEFDVLFAPYDVRQGNFTGGQITAVTRSGTNTLQGAIFGYYQSQALVGDDSAGNAAPNFGVYQYGGSIGGPIIQDRLHYFVAAEFRHRTSPFLGAEIAPGSNVGIPVDSANRFVSLLNGYGINPGSYGPFTTVNDAANVFGKLSLSTGTSGLLEWSVNYVHGTTTDSIAPSRAVNGDYRLTSAAFAPEATTWSTRARWTTLLAQRFSNEALIGYSSTDEPRTAASAAPAVFVSNVGNAGTRLIAGADPSSQNLALEQRWTELTDNLTAALGAHTVTVGAQAQLMHFSFSNFASAIGQYQFLNLDSLAAGRPSRYIRNVALDPSAATANFGAVLGGVYAQDAWQVTDRFVATLGVRLDVTNLPDRPTFNDSLAASPIGVTTSRFIGTSVLASPRLGLNWAVRNGTDLRGGVGIFTGHDPFSWLAFAYSNTGTGARLLNCAGAAAPNFVPNPNAQPTSCVTGSSASAASVSYFVPNFKMPQSVKTSLGVDQRLPWGVVASLDLSYVRGLNSLYITDDNLTGPVGTLRGEGGRAMYGTVAGASAKGALPAVTPSVVTPAFGPVLRNANHSGDRTYLGTVQVQKQFANGMEFDAAYTSMNAKDYFSLRDAQSVSNYGFAPVDGSLASRNLAVSSYSVPNQVTLSGTVNGPYGLAFSTIYLGRSGSPYTYVVNGDANADGVGNKVGAFDRQADDPVYVPTGPADISLVRDSAIGGGANLLVKASPAAYDSLEKFIESDACLRQHRGILLPRNACRNPWQNIVNARVAKRVSLPSGHSVEVSLDIFNVLHLLNADWGLVRETGTLSGAGTENVPLLRLRGQDTIDGRNLYDLTLPARNVINVDASRWRLQLGARWAL